MGLRGKNLAIAVALFAVGLFSAYPLITDRLVGTGEAYNYSLSVADAVTQMRAGIFPPLAGQTPYAFNGRIHPLRDAPYLHYVAYVIDLAAGHKAPMWQLQTISLTLSLVAALFACYLGLRWGIECPRLPAFLLSLVYGLSPALLGAAYSFDLYMTVHVAVYVPLVVAACIRSTLRPSFSADAWLAAALAMAWMAHPPVALWLTGSVAIFRVNAFLQAPTWREVGRAACAVVLAGCLACFVFVSTSSLGYPLTFFSRREGWDGFSKVIMDSLRDVFPACLRPVTRGASMGGDLQLGYVPWILFLLTLVGLFRAPWRRGTGNGPIRAAAAGSVAVTLFLLLLVLPVPGLTHLLWFSLPPGVLSLTSIWPFQRLYLVALPFVLFAAAMVLPKAFSDFRLPRWVAFCAVILGLAWTGYQAKAFISRGLSDRWTMPATRSAYRSSNLDLTVTSYAFVQIPPSFVYGVMDPAFEYRLLRNGTEEIASPFAAALATSPAVEHGTIRLGIPSAVTLKPGKHYLLKFSFRFPTLDGHIQISGPKLFRLYALPSSGAARAFGMLKGERPAISIWTDSEKPEPVDISFFVVPPAGTKSPVLADYELLEVNPSELPVRFEGYLPMRFSVDSPTLGCTVETPQRYIPGYEATVNGKRVTVLSSPDMQVMVPVPHGHSEVVLFYRGPRSARTAFWFCIASWAAFLLWRLCGSWTPERPFGVLADAGRSAWRNRVAVLSVVVVAIALTAECMHVEHLRALRDAVGPIEVDFKLPYGKIGGNQPLLATGHPHAGCVIFITCLDESHVRLGADVWGQLFESDPIETDFSSEQQMIVSDSALFPKDNPGVFALTPPEISRFRGELDVEFNGRTAIKAKCYSYETTPAEILAGATRFGSLTGPSFSGEIIRMRRLTIPRLIFLPWGRSVHMEVNFPKGMTGTSEPLLAASADGMTDSCFVTYLSDKRSRLTLKRSDGTPSQAVEVDTDSTRVYPMDFKLGQSSGSAHGLAMSAILDGKPLLGDSPAQPSYSPPLIASGINLADIPGVQERYSGPLMDLSLEYAAPSSGPGGPLHMIVMLPEDKIGRSEPLVGTGHKGAGDFVYVSYLDASHIRIGFDHWGTAAVTSKPISVDYGAPHEIWIDMSSLNPASGQGAGRAVTVTFDGSMVISEPVTPYPATEAEMTIGQNLIGGSTEDPAFSGGIDFVERLGTAQIPPPKS
jgi:hypothetical protein